MTVCFTWDEFFESTPSVLALEKTEFKHSSKEMQLLFIFIEQHHHQGAFRFLNTNENMCIQTITIDRKIEGLGLSFSL